MLPQAAERRGTATVDSSVHPPERSLASLSPPSPRFSLSADLGLSCKSFLRTPRQCSDVTTPLDIAGHGVAAWHPTADIVRALSNAKDPLLAGCHAMCDVRATRCASGPVSVREKDPVLVQQPRRGCATTTFTVAQLIAPCGLVRAGSEAGAAPARPVRDYCRYAQFSSSRYSSTPPPLAIRPKIFTRCSTCRHALLGRSADRRLGLRPLCPLLPGLARKNWHP